MRPYPYFLFILTTIGFASEPSAFEAGDLNSKNPYGLTRTEKYILENKENINDLKNRIIHLETSLQDLSTGLDAFRSITTGGNEKLFSLAKQLGAIQSDLTLQAEYQKKIDGDISTFVQNQSLINKEDRQTDENLKTAIKELSTLIDNISNNYVQKEEMKKALEKLLKEIEGSSKPATASNTPSKKEGFKGKKASDILADSKDLYKKKKFDEALEGLEYLGQTSDYEKAEVMYLLGEIYYQTANYSKAITAFKSSVKLDDKASYLPALLFHTGIAYSKLGNKSEAKKFYESLIALYPDSYLVESAKKRLSDR